jgi:hypothetical protein
MIWENIIKISCLVNYFREPSQHITDFTLKKRLKKSITQKSLGGEFIKEWSSANKIHTNLRIDGKIIRKLCKNGGGVYAGYFWFFS